MAAARHKLPQETEEHGKACPGDFLTLAQLAIGRVRFPWLGLVVLSMVPPQISPERRELDPRSGIRLHMPDRGRDGACQMHEALLGFKGAVGRSCCQGRGRAPGREAGALLLTPPPKGRPPAAGAPISRL